MLRAQEEGLFTFAQLLEMEKSGENWRAADRARQKLGEWTACDDWWHEYITEDMWPKALGALGFEGAEIAFNGFWCQGDGASFTCDVNVHKLLWFMGHDWRSDECVQAGNNGQEIWWPWVVHQLGLIKWQASEAAEALAALGEEWRDSLDAEVQRLTRQYVHENTCSFYAHLDIYMPEDKLIHQLVNEWEQEAEELRRDLCRAIYKCLEEEYYYQVSDEALLESAEANGWLFDEEGELT